MAPWGDLVTAHHSTGIPNIEDYAALPASMRRAAIVGEKLRPLLRFSLVRSLMSKAIPRGPTDDEIAATRVHVWGEVTDDAGGKAVSRLHGPEPGVAWTSLAALAAVDKVLAGDAPPGFQTPAMAYGPDFVLECEGVTREDVT